MKVIFLLISLLWQANTGFCLKAAVVIGHNDGGSKVEKLNYAEQDAGEFSGILTELAGFEKKDVHLLLQPDSLTLAGVLNEVRQKFETASGAGSENLFLIFYSGHADNKGLNLAEESFSLASIKAYIQDFPAGIRIGIFDACQSGAITEFKGGTRSKPFYLRQKKDVKGQVIIASSAATELAQESEALKGSVFSHHWFNGLRGSADNSGDNQVTLNEAYQYAYRKTVETTALTGGGIQHPSYQFKIFGKGEIVLTDLKKASSGLLLGNEFTGTHLVLSSDYADVFADFHKKEGNELFLPLGPGSYTLIQSQTGEARLHQFDITSDNIYRVKQASLKENPVTWNKVKGSQPRVEKIEIKVSTRPLSVWSWNIGLGMTFPDVFDENRGSGIWAMNLSAGYFIKPGLNGKFGGSVLFDDKRLYGLHGGLEYDFVNKKLINLPLFFYYGAGVNWSLKSDYTFNGPAKPELDAALGFSFQFSEISTGSIRFPVRYIFGGENFIDDSFYTLGIQFALTFTGKHRNVRKLVY